MTGEHLKLIILLMQDLNLWFVVKLGAIPPPILATIALMTELNKTDRPETEGQQSLEYVDFENLVRPSTRPARQAVEVLLPGLRSGLVELDNLSVFALRAK
jgi:hypothetical protein